LEDIKGQIPRDALTVTFKLSKKRKNLKYTKGQIPRNILPTCSSRPRRERIWKTWQDKFI